MRALLLMFQPSICTQISPSVFDLVESDHGYHEKFYKPYLYVMVIMKKKNFVILVENLFSGTYDG